jgi:hypothetical protein
MDYNLTVMLQLGNYNHNIISMKKPLPEARIRNTAFKVAGVGALQSGSNIAALSLLSGCTYESVATFRFAQISRHTNYDPKVSELCIGVRKFRRDLARLYIKTSLRSDTLFTDIKKTRRLFNELKSTLDKKGALDNLSNEEKKFLKLKLKEADFILNKTYKETATIRQAEVLTSLITAFALVLEPYLILKPKVRESESSSLKIEADLRGLVSYKNHIHASDTYTYTPRDEMPDTKDFEARVHKMLRANQIEGKHNDLNLTRRLYQIAKAQKQSFVARIYSASRAVNDLVNALPTDNSIDYKSLANTFQLIFKGIEKSAINFGNPLALSYHPLGKMFFSLYLFTRATSLDKKADSKTYKEIMQGMTILIELEAKWFAYTSADGSYDNFYNQASGIKNNRSYFANLGPHYFFHDYVDHFLRPTFDMGALLFPLFRKFGLQHGLTKLNNEVNNLENRNKIITERESGIRIEQYSNSSGTDLPVTVLQEIMALQESVLVNPSKSRKQSGLFSVIPEDVIRARMSENDALAQCLYHNNELQGVYIVCSKQDKLTKLGNDLRKILIDKNIIEDNKAKEPIILVDLIAQSKNTFEFGLKSGTTPGQLAMPFLEGLVQTQFPFSEKVTCVAICRVNPIENKTLEKALQQGWEKVPDVIYEEEGLEYAVITYTYSPASIFE